MQKIWLPGLAFQNEKFGGTARRWKTSFFHCQVSWGWEHRDPDSSLAMEFHGSAWSREELEKEILDRLRNWENWAGWLGFILLTIKIYLWGKLNPKAAIWCSPKPSELFASRQGSPYEAGLQTLVHECQSEMIKDVAMCWKNQLCRTPSIASFACVKPRACPVQSTKYHFKDLLSRDGREGENLSGMGSGSGSHLIQFWSDSSPPLTLSISPRTSLMRQSWMLNEGHLVVTNSHGIILSPLPKANWHFAFEF